jgi:hypothetical protein
MVLFQHASVFRGKPLHCARHNFECLCHCICPFRVRRRIGNLPSAPWLVGFGTLIKRYLGARFSLSQEHRGGIDCDSREPRGEGAGLSELMQVTVRVQEAVLYDIVCVFWISDDTVHPFPDGSQMPVAQLFKGPSITGLGGREQLIVRGIRICAFRQRYWDFDV